MSEERRGGEEKRVTSIRGIDRDLYERACVLARETGRTVGEIVNEALKMLLAAAEVSSKGVLGVAREFIEGVRESGAPATVVGGVDELTVTAQDLEEVDAVVFRGIKRLAFSPDVPYELFDKKVKGIVLCDEVTIPEGYPKLKVLNKCRMVKRLVKR